MNLENKKKTQFNSTSQFNSTVQLNSPIEVNRGTAPPAKLHGAGPPALAQSARRENRLLVTEWNCIVNSELHSISKLNRIVNK